MSDRERHRGSLDMKRERKRQRRQQQQRQKNALSVCRISKQNSTTSLAKSNDCECRLM